MVCLAGIIWMFLNGAYLVMLSFGPIHLTEHGMPIAQAGSLVSVMSWVFMVALPLGGYVATRWKLSDAVMVGGLVAGVILGVDIPFSTSPLLVFMLFGVALALATPVVGALPADVLEPGVRGPGFGIYYLWYFGGMPALIALAGFLRDRTGSTTASIILAAAMLACCLVLLGVFRLAQVQLRRRAAS